MRQFSAAPAVPIDYSRLAALSAEEIEAAVRAGYVALEVDPSAPVQRRGLENSSDIPPDDINDWRIRMYVIWFCYIYENIDKIRRPLAALEELIFEFKASSALDIPGSRIATDYAGAGSVEPLSENELGKQRVSLKPHYQKARVLLKM